MFSEATQGSSFNQLISLEQTAFFPPKDIARETSPVFFAIRILILHLRSYHQYRVNQHGDSWSLNKSKLLFGYNQSTFAV